MSTGKSIVVGGSERNRYVNGNDTSLWDGYFMDDSASVHGKSSKNNETESSVLHSDETGSAHSSTMYPDVIDLVLPFQDVSSGGNSCAQATMTMRVMVCIFLYHALLCHCISSNLF